MKILVTGGDGQLGRAFRKILPKKNSFFMTKKDFDITDKKQTTQQITSIRPEIVIHTAAYTDVDGCEKNPNLACEVNVKGTDNIAMASRKIGAVLVYLSTDYIFDGQKKSPYKESDMPNPLSVYGKTKLQGEEILKNLPQFFIIRTAWLFGEGKNFVQTILNLTKEKKEIQVVNDQIGSPTYSLDLAKAIWQLINKNQKGVRQAKIKNQIYHITNSGFCSWYDFAKKITEYRNLKSNIIPITSNEWRKIRLQSAKRPGYSILSNKKIASLGIKMRPWPAALKEYLKTIS